MRDAIGRDPNAAEGGRTPTPAMLKQWLDDNGLEAEGNHGQIPSSITEATLASFDAACEAANVLGMGHIATAADGSSVQDIFDPLGTVNTYGPLRYPLFHAKDGASRPGTSNGYDIEPFSAGDIDYVKFLGGVGAKPHHNPMWEQDTAPSANPAVHC